jgi:hypothetical protein
MMDEQCPCCRGRYGVESQMLPLGRKHTRLRYGGVLLEVRSELVRVGDPDQGAREPLSVCVGCYRAIILAAEGGQRDGELCGSVHESG